MDSLYCFEYAKSGRAKCHGSCGGGLIEKGALRCGKKYVHPTYGPTYSWMHWQCTGSELRNLSTYRPESMFGFRYLLPVDQSRIRRDVSAGKIVHQTPNEGPSSSQTVPSSSQTVPSSRRSTRPSGAVSTAPSSSQASAGRKRKPETAQAQTSTQSQPIIVIDDSDEYFDENQDEVKDELYISLATKVVGVQYYTGMVGPGEEVTLVRQPQNKFDSNAIQVLNISGTQVGHIPRAIAEKLSPLIDKDLVNIEGIIHEGNIGGSGFSISMALKIYGASHRRAELERLLIWATPKQRGFTDAMRPAGYQAGQMSAGMPSGSDVPAHSSSGPAGMQAAAAPVSSSQRKNYEARLEAFRQAEELRSMLSSLEKVDDEGRRASLLDVVCPTQDILNLPEHPSPPSVASGELKVDLMRHQTQALLWCVERENPVIPTKESDPPVQFWQYRIAPGRPRGYYLNIATKTPQETPPILGRGGLMADAMGLGKTLTMLSLVLATKKDVPEHFSNATLIVVPLSVLSNWRIQISDHFTYNSLTYHVYYEAGRNISSEEIKKFDVVITTYQIVAQDFATKSGVNETDGRSRKKQKLNDGLFHVKWKRIILDEGHTIRNSRTKMAKAVRELEAQRRWVVTGTPIINSPKDLGSLLQFLRICRPLDNEDYFKRLLMRPLAQSAPEGAELLKALMSHVCIRRTKEMQNSKGEHLVPLPPVEMTVIPVQLDPATRELYDEIEKLSQQRFTSLMEYQTTSGSPPANVLSLLTRLRQMALHPALVPRDYLDHLRSLSSADTNKPLPAIPVTQTDRIRLQALLARAIEDCEECPVCFDVLNNPRITPCAHSYCFACISEVLSRDPKCPMDRRIINTSDLIEPPPPTDLTQAPPITDTEDDLDEVRKGSSAKIDQLVHLLQLTPKSEKSLVFSQFTGFLDKIAEELEINNIPFARFDGQLSARRRQEVLERFCKPLAGTDGKVINDTPVPAKRPRPSLTTKTTDAFDSDLKDHDFIPDNQSDSDDSFIDDSDDDGVWTRGKGKGKAKAKPKKPRPKMTRYYDELAEDENPVVLLISLKAGALGLNLTVANNVYLMDPWWQEGIESQAIDRCNRIGQTKPVHVYQLVAENTVETKVLDIQERKKKLIKEAFSGIKSTETQRQRREARLQDLIQLFGARQNETA